MQGHHGGLPGGSDTGRNKSKECSLKTQDCQTSNSVWETDIGELNGGIRDDVGHEGYNSKWLGCLSSGRLEKWTCALAHTDRKKCK